MRIRLTVSEQFGDEGPRAGDEGRVIGSTYDEGDRWLFVFFDGYSKNAYYSVRDDMVEVIDEG